MRRLITVIGLGGGVLALVLLLGPVVGAQTVGGPSAPPAPSIHIAPPVPPEHALQGPASPPKYTDLAPLVPATKKWGIVIRHRDGSYEAYFMPNGQVRNFVQRLPRGDIWATTFPPTPLTPASPVPAP